MITRIPANSFMYFLLTCKSTAANRIAIAVPQADKVLQKNNTGNPPLKNEAGELDYAVGFFFGKIIGRRSV